MFSKHKILDIQDVYTANAFLSDGSWKIGAGSETGPDVRLYDLPSDSHEKIPGCPGGMMSFLPVPGQTSAYVSIMGLFPPFIGGEAGLWLLKKKNGSWESVKMCDLPFAHRCEFLEYEGKSFLLAATVSRHKENPPDWSKPGELHVVEMGSTTTSSWSPIVIDSGITRNHGMTKGKWQGNETIFVSGAEGIFSVLLDKPGKWMIERIFEKEVSEMTFIDLDGDGTRELATIEPFHGSSLNIYKDHSGSWELLCQSPLSFGHGLSSGHYRGTPVIVTGNRSDNLELQVFVPENPGKGLFRKVFSEEGAGPTQTQVFSAGGEDFILSVNQKKNEVVLYSGSFS